MGILTWQNVPVGDLSAGQEGFRTASMLLDRATNAGQEGIAAYQSILDSKKAFEQQMADRAVVAKMMSIQDPEEYKKALAAGLVDPSIAQAASLGSLMQANKQMDVLQGRAQADQQLLNTKQSFDALAYKMGREQEGDRLSDAAMPVFNEALKVAVTDRAKALKMIEDSNVHLEDKLKMAESLRTQYQDKSQQWRLAMEQRQLNILTTAEQVRQVLSNKASNNPALQGQLLNDFANNVDNPALAAFKKLDPQSRALVSRAVRVGLNQEDPEFFRSVGALNATGGTAPIDTPENPNARVIQLLDNAVKNPNLSPGAKIKAAAQPFAMNTAAQMAEMVKKTRPDFNTEAFTNAIVKIRSKLPEGVEINEGELAHMLLNSMDESGPLSIDNFGKDKNLDQGIMDKLVETVTNSKIEINEYHQALRVQEKVADLVEKRNKFISELSSLKRLGKQGRDVTASIKEAEEQIATVDRRIASITTSQSKAEENKAKRDKEKKDEADKIAKEKEEADKRAARQTEEERKKLAALNLLNRDEMKKRREMDKKYGSMMGPLKL